MRLLPRSLFSRLVLVLLGGQVVAQLLSFAIHMQERGELLLQSGGMQSAQRIADTVRLLDSSGPAERRKIVNVLSAAPLLVSLDHGPLVLSGQGGSSDAAGGVNVRAAFFAGMIRRYLGGDWPIEVIVSESALSTSLPTPGPGHGRRPGSAAPGAPGHMRGGFGGGMHMSMLPGLSFVSQVRLHDGVLVTFDARQPEHTTGWPYRMLLSLAVLLVAVVAVSLLAVRWATRPLKALADAADELGQNIHRPPMEENGPVEVVRAARAFNTMQARLTAYLSERTSVLAAMSHDLKTPVTRLRLRAELLGDPQLRLKFIQDLEEMEAMVGATLDFLRGAGSAETAQPVDMTALLESLQADLAEVGSQVSLEGRPLRPYTGRPAALKRCLRNLVENAVKYGQSAEIEVDDNDVRLQILIRDYGPGIPETELKRVFEPFYRLEGSRSRDTGGTGLGLTIAKSIAELHGGRLTLENRATGGLDARLILPR